MERRYFKHALASQNQQLKLIIDGLDKEIKAREKEDETIIRKLDKVGSMWGTFKAGFNVFWLLLAALAGAGLTVLFERLVR